MLYKECLHRTNLQIIVEDEEDRQWLQESLQQTGDDRAALADLCDGHTGWLGNQGPAPTHFPALSQAPQLATGLEHDENGVPRYRGLYAYRAYEGKDWRVELLAAGIVVFQGVGKR